MTVRPLLSFACLCLATFPGDASARPLVQEHEAFAPLPNPRGDTYLPGAGCYVDASELSAKEVDYTLPRKGYVEVRLHGYAGDWDLFLFDRTDRMVAKSATSAFNQAETARIAKGPAGMRLRIVACNWSGGPHAKVTISFVALR